MIIRLAFLFIALIAMAFGLIGGDCSQPLSDPVRNLSGVVADSASGLPIENAWVDINDTIPPHHAYTDTNGFYDLLLGFGTAALDLHLFVGKKGYLTEDTIVSLPGGQVNVDSVKFYLQPN